MNPLGSNQPADLTLNVCDDCGRVLVEMVSVRGLPFAPHPNNAS